MAGESMALSTRPALDAPEPTRFAQRKAAILRTAAEVINRKGVRGMTLGEVAARLDMVPTAVSYYFRRKEDLAAACFLEGIARYETLIDQALLQEEPRARLHAFLGALAREMQAVEAGRGEEVAAFNDVRAIGDPVVDTAYTELFRRARRAFNRPGLPEPVRLHRNARTHLLLSQAFWSVLWLKRYDSQDYPRLIERMLDILVHGLAAPGVAWRPLALPLADGAQERGRVSRETFLRAATQLINEHGYLGASVSRISARLNVTKGSFYHHIQAKDDLVALCFERTLGLMREAQQAADAATTTGLDNLASLAVSLVRRDISDEAPLLRTSALTAVPEEMAAHYIQRFERVSARFASVVSDGIADGSIRPVDANVAAQMITATINASAELHHWAPGLDAANAAEIYVKPLFIGLLTSPADR